MGSDGTIAQFPLVSEKVGQLESPDHGGMERVILELHDAMQPTIASGEACQTHRRPSPQPS